jgi:hypothetical protein
MNDLFPMYVFHKGTIPEVYHKHKVPKYKIERIYYLMQRCMQQMKYYTRLKICTFRMQTMTNTPPTTSARLVEA